MTRPQPIDPPSPAAPSPASPPVAAGQRLDDPARVAALRGTGLLDAVSEGLEQLARSAAERLGAPVALVSLVDVDRQWLAGVAGLTGEVAERRQTPLSHSFCRHVVASGEALVVDDALAHPVLRDNPAVAELGVRAYAGVPLVTAAGQTLGAFCAIDLAPHAWTAGDVAELEGLARGAMAEIEQRVARATLAGEASALDTVLARVGALEWAWEFRTDVVRRRGGLLACLGYPDEEVRSSAAAGVGWWLDRVHPDDRPLQTGRAAAIRAGADPDPDVVYRFRRTDGSYATLASYCHVVRDADGTVARAVGIDLDVTARAEADRAHRESEARLRLALEAARMVAWELDLRGRPHGAGWLDGARLTIDGASADSHATGAAFLRDVHPDDRAAVEGAIARAVARAGPGPAAPGAVSQEFRVVLPGGEVRWRHATGRVVDDGLRLVGVSLDVTRRKALEARLTEQAIRDPLTGLANRTHFGDRVAGALAQRRPGHTPVVLFVDVDDFKTVNDSLGHAAGDRLLRIVADRLLDATRGSDTVARLGGDEFAVLLGGVRNAGEAELVADRVIGGLTAPFPVGGREIRVGASIGIAVAAGDEDPEALLRNADLALYRAKALGRGRHVLYEPAMHAEAVERLELEAELRRAVADGGLHLQYQPIVDLATGRVTGAEALARWRHPRRGVVPPAVFIPLAEATDLIVPLGRWVLEEACRTAAGWRGEGDAALPTISVNVSARQLHRPGFVRDVAHALAASGLAPGQLVLEVTETVLLADLETALGRLNAIRALGVRVALDDFGTGYSSLAYLQRLPVDVLKIDSAFTATVHADARQAAVVRAVVALARTLDLGTVAEGVETAAQAAALAAMGCGAGQGYLYARPLDAEAFARLAPGARLDAVPAAA